MFVTAACVLFLLKLKWPKNKSFDEAFLFVYTYSLLDFFLPHRQWRHSLEVHPS